MKDPERLDDLSVERPLGEMTPEEIIGLQILAEPAGFFKFYLKFYPSKRNTNSTPRITLRWVIKAACLLLIPGGLWLYLTPFSSGKMISRQPAKTTLYWKDDSMVLEAMEEGRCYKAGEMRIARMGNEFFITTEVVTAAMGYHLFVEGKDPIQLFFPDTTRMQAYSGSTLSFTIYPSDTVPREKEMTCSGHVLFDVHHNYAIPFIVRTSKVEIVVLGTLFAVRDYAKEDTGAVFCYNGKVAVKNKDSLTRTLTAFQRVTVHSAHSEQEETVSTGDFPQAQWSSPELPFDFTYLSLDSAMREIAYWYGKNSVEFGTGIDRETPGTVLIGKLSRYLTLRHLLSILDRNDLHFSTQGQTIRVNR